MNIELLKTELVKDEYLKEIIYFDELDSTNSYAKKNELVSDTLIVTSHQTNGIGRFNRQWLSSPDKDLTFTLYKTINVRVDEVHIINFYSSYILYLTIKSYLPEVNVPELFLKWPNDIMLNKKKIAGILLEVKDLNRTQKKFIIGIGLNVNNLGFSDELELKATSLFKEISTKINVEILLINFVKIFFDNFFLVNNKDELMKLWISYTNLIGKKINFRKVEDDEYQTVTAFAIDPDGGLKVKYDDGLLKKYYSGEISLLYQ